MATAQSWLGAHRGASVDRVQSGLEDLRVEALRLIALPLVGLGLAVLALNLQRERPDGWEPPALLALSGALAYGLSGWAPVLARLTLTAGLAITATSCLYVYDGAPFAAAYSLVVVVAAILLGWRWGLTTAAATSCLLLGIAGPLGGPLSGPSLGTAIALVWVAAILSWLALWPLYTALDWSWASYQQALRKTQELQQRQGELNNALKELDRACYRLERANEELARAREAAEEARRLKAEFATSISHELRTPINLIIGFSELMVIAPKKSYGESLPESYCGDLEAIYRNACHISNLIDDVLDLAQVDAHRMGLHRETVVLSKIVGEATAAVSRLFRDKCLELSVELPPDLPPLQVDPTRIRQVLINLLANAARFTEQGGVRVAARCDGSDVVIAVADTGQGITPEDLPQVFQEFRQFSRGEGVRYRGSGLGLAISKRLVELHGGSIRVESQLGAGTTFCVSLPLCDNVASAAYSRDLTPLAPTRHRRVVLLVDDDPRAVRLFERYLDGYTVRAVGDRGRARELAPDAACHAIVVADSLRESRSVTRLIEANPGVPLVSYSFRLPYDAAAGAGIAEYLVKPVSREQLRSALRRLGKPVRRVLVTDDDPEMASLLTRMLRSLCRGCEVLEAHSGEDGLRLLRERRPDLLLLDILMPGMDGYGVLAAIREDPSLADVRTIVVSARGRAEESVVVRAVGVSRPGGLTVREGMRCMRAALDALLAPESSAPAPPVVPAG